MDDDRPRARRGGFPPVRRSLGQHFLTDRRVLARIADALELTGGETVVEIGPGRGALTELLLPRAGRVVAVEYDRALAALLRERWHDESRLTMVERDVLEVPLAEAAGTDDFVLAGNVPYYITTPILFHALERPRPRRAVYLVQREVADRAAAPPGDREYGALSVNLQSVARVERLFRVPAGAFAPPPRVESAVIRLTPRPDPAVAPDEEARYRTMVQGAFGMRRKQMRRIVRSLFDVPPERAESLLTASAIDPEARPETLSAERFAALMRAARDAGS